MNVIFIGLAIGSLIFIGIAYDLSNRKNSIRNVSINRGQTKSSQGTCVN